MPRILSLVASLLLILLLALSAFAAFRLLEANIAADVYQERLAEMAADYELLRDRYNQAVRRTAVTELRVADGKLTVVIRTADGTIQELESPFDPTNEIYVDYVVLNGRLWIRRVFDGHTPPQEGMTIDPQFIDVDWDAAGESHGKAAYRALTEGRWVVDVTGDGSLGLTLRDDAELIELAPPPPVRRYAPIEAAVDDALGSIRPSEALEALARQLGA
jgi:hypothetical protein